MGVIDLFLQSTSSLSLLGALVVLLLVYLVSSSSSSQEKGQEPPGPKPLPLLGNLLQLDFKRLDNTLVELSKKYGSVFQVHFGPKKVVVLSGYKTVKEALVTLAEEFGDRDPLLMFDDYNQGHGIIWANGDSWREMRRFALTNLRDFGMGKKACENKIIEECNHLVDVIKNFKGEPFDTREPMGCAASNIISSIVYGSRFEYGDPEFKGMLARSSRLLELSASLSLQIYNIFPWMAKWTASRKESLMLFQQNIKQNQRIFSYLKETLNPQMCRGFVDAFLVQQQTTKESGTANSYFHDKNLMVTVSNLFSTGTDTTAITLRWALLLMAKYPKVQEQVQEELSRVIGGRQVQVADRTNLPFTDAVIHETQRMANIVPLGVPHRTSRDVTLQGHFIKKGTTIYPFLTSVLHDESEWEHPHSFHPAHFLDKDGKFFKPDAFMPFSAGRRACPGESLARMELLIFFTTLLQHFRFTAPPGVSEEDLSLVPDMAFGMRPLSHKLCAVSRV